MAPFENGGSDGRHLSRSLAAEEPAA